MSRQRSWPVLSGLWLCLMATSIGAAENGFVALFDGQTLEGWRGYRQEEVPDGWSVREGAIYSSGKGTDLITVDQFDDFELHFQWKIAPGGNSGVIYRCTEEMPHSHQTGPEYQILDDAQAREKLAATQSTAALYGLYGKLAKELQSAGEYNEGKIIVQGSHIEHWLNGSKIVDCEVGSEDWKKRLAASKFAAWPEFMRSRQGHIALQTHGSPVWFRDLKIKRLPSEP